MDRRNTKQKEIVYKAVVSRMDHPTADDIYRDVSKLDQKISLGTVCRNLDILNEEGKINEIEMPDKNRYDLTTYNHNHFVCEKCGKVFDISIKYDDSFDNTVTSEGFNIKSHQTVFKGLCKECSK